MPWDKKKQAGLRFSSDFDNFFNRNSAKPDVSEEVDPDQKVMGPTVYSFQSSFNPNPNSRVSVSYRKEERPVIINGVTYIEVGNDQLREQSKPNAPVMTRLQCMLREPEDYRPEAAEQQRREQENLKAEQQRREK